MKIIAALLLLIGLASCAHDLSPPTINGLAGYWYSGRALNRTDYRLDDCLYSSDGTFKCTAIDRGCNGSFCEAQSASFVGTWSIDGNRLTRRCNTNWCSDIPKTWIIERQDRRVLQLAGGERWYRSKSTRSELLMSAL
jgi:hypothetical protein